jgi:hypothetical protein
MSRGGGGIRDASLVFVFFVLGFAWFGPMVAGKFATSWHQSIVLLAPVVGSLMVIVFGVLMVRYWWGR